MVYYKVPRPCFVLRLREDLNVYFDRSDVWPVVLDYRLDHGCTELGVLITGMFRL